MFIVTDKKSSFTGKNLKNGQTGNMERKREVIPHESTLLHLHIWLRS